MFEIKKSEDIYSMTSNPKGFCVILNIINFEGDKYEERNDSFNDVCLIKSAFEPLNFSVITYFDLKYKDIFLNLNELINREECDHHDAFVLYIHSHGKETGFITSDNKIIEFEDIIEVFSDKNCRKFIEKPKMVFFDCCRGS